MENKFFKLTQDKAHKYSFQLLPGQQKVPVPGTSIADQDAVRAVCEEVKQPPGPKRELENLRQSGKKKKIPISFNLQFIHYCKGRDNSYSKIISELNS